MALIAAFLGWMFDGFEMGLFPLVSRPALIDLLGEAGKDRVELWMGLMTAGFLVGAATGGVLFGWLGDRIGRVRAMTLSVLAYALFSGLCGVANSATQIFALRFLAALGMGGEWSLGVALVMEIWPNRSRGMLAGLIGAASNVGFLMIACFGLALASSSSMQSMESALRALGVPQSSVSVLVANSGWRLLMLLGAAPALLTFFIRLVVPESERWLHAQSQGVTSNWASQDLLVVLLGACGPLFMIYIWANNYNFSMQMIGAAVGIVLALLGYTYPVVRYLQRTKAANPASAPPVGSTLGRMFLGACLSGTALLGTWGAIQFAPAWADKLVQSAPHEGVTKEALDHSRSQARAYTQIFSGLGAILGTMAGALIGNAIGRRITYCGLCILSLASALIFFKLNTGYGPLFLTTIFFAGMTTASFYGWLPLYLPELFRTSVRATGQGFSFNFGRILAAVGALQTGNLIGHFKGSYPDACSSLCLVYLVGMVIIWFAPETRGKPLPE